MTATDFVTVAQLDVGIPFPGQVHVVAAGGFQRALDLSGRGEGQVLFPDAVLGRAGILATVAGIEDDDPATDHLCGHRGPDCGNGQTPIEALHGQHGRSFAGVVAQYIRDRHAVGAGPRGLQRLGGGEGVWALILGRVCGDPSQRLQLDLQRMPAGATLIKDQRIGDRHGFEQVKNDARSLRGLMAVAH